ncbi:hypothetical protein [Actinocrispum wychmicini]|uniref:Glycosyl transferase family 2 n=1 Tax=Actinocrispum wychmicini TaxID=1213861 RepID=A0A4R2J5G4_9PSEU|nr:hypothetical protein [Actinocrispum wychmicini]TCO53564.1 hypothetical protein EV192_110153 [Actinocrispum wychmicini]
MTAAPVRQTTNHHGTHRKLVETVSDPTPAKVDAIIVPTARPARHLDQALKLAKHHDCTLVALCSKHASANRTMEAAGDLGVEVVAVNTSVQRADLLPQFATTDLLANTKFERYTDTSYKRNLGLLLSWMAGWKRVAFLDDDIQIPEMADLGGAMGSVGHFASVGLTITGQPDNSVVCHAFRDAGGEQDTFIGGGALAVGEESFNSFFPNIYNEDWFFLLNDHGLRPSALTTGVVMQQPYDPYRTPMRARMEELGDSLAEGLFWLLDNNRPLADADHTSYWDEFLNKRRRFIDEVIAMVDRAPRTGADRARMTESLKAARGRNWVIESQLCVDYMAAWRADRELWRDKIHSTRRWHDLEKALAQLGLNHCHLAAP